MIEKAWLDSILLNTFEPIVQRSGGRVCNWEDLDSGEAVCIGVDLYLTLSLPPRSQPNVSSLSPLLNVLRVTTLVSPAILSPIDRKSVV